MYYNNVKRDLDFTLKFSRISNTIYQTGVTEHEDLLIKYSNVDELKAHLDSLVSDVSSVREMKEPIKRNKFYLRNMRH